MSSEWDHPTRRTNSVKRKQRTTPDWPGPGWFGLELEPEGPFGRTRWTIVFAEGLALTGIRWGTRRARREMRHYYEQLRKVQ